MPVHELQEVITYSHFVELKAYEEMQPHGEARADLRNGILCSIVANQWRSKGAAAKPEDFMPKFDADCKKNKGLSADELKQKLIGALRAV